MNMNQNATIQPWADEHRQLERLLEEQRDALLQDDYDIVEKKSQEITGLVARLQADNKLPSGECLETLREMNNKLMQLLVVKKETTAAEIANVRRRRDLNRSYGAQDK
jgi:hypothetical protein